MKHIKLIEPEISGGKISKETIQSLENSSAKKLTISGLRQDTFEYLIANFAQQFESIWFWKCPLVEDLSALADLENIQEIEWFWNQKSTKLWDCSKNKNLRSLVLHDFKKVQTLNELSNSTSIEELTIQSGMWERNKYGSLEPLSNLKNLKFLALEANIIDNRVTPITNIQNLESLEFSPNLFSTEKIAWLKAQIGDKVNSPCLSAYIDCQDEVMIMGKRKPFVNPKTEEKKFNNYVKKFNDLVAYYLEHPKLEEPN